MGEQEAIASFTELAFAHTTLRLKEVSDKKLKLAHYTTAESAALIIKNKSLWLRNSNLMNDFSEISHGTSCFQAVLEGAEAWKRLANAVSAVYPGLLDEVIASLNEVKMLAHKQTYLCSLAEHQPTDRMGKLSMWRAYGGPTAGVAIVFNSEPLFVENSDLGVYSSPVLYGGYPEFTVEFDNVVNKIESNIETLKLVPRHIAHSIFLNSFQYAVFSTKHPAFGEEKEWRLLHSPFVNPSSLLKQNIHTIRGIPQTIYEIPLNLEPEFNKPWLTLDKLIYQIIIGPCQYPGEVSWALMQLLEEAGVSKPETRIVVADIPLRQIG